MLPQHRRRCSRIASVAAYQPTQLTTPRRPRCMRVRAHTHRPPHTQRRKIRHWNTGCNELTPKRSRPGMSGTESRPRSTSRGETPSWTPLRVLNKERSVFASTGTEICSLVGWLARQTLMYENTHTNTHTCCIVLKKMLYVAPVPDRPPVAELTTALGLPDMKAVSIAVLADGS